MEMEGDADVRMFLKGNNEHGYLYVGNNDRPKKYTQKAIASREGRTRSCDHGIIYRRIKRAKDDIVEEGHKGAGVKRWVTCEYRHDERHS